jgi:putative FmdB family regulatory protein
MPIYEYQCEQDGSVIEVIRPMAEADKPVEDPEGKGRVFRRKHSTFAPGGSAAGQGRSIPLNGGGGCCPCGKPHNSCSRN